MSRTWTDTTEQAAEVDLTDRHRRPLSIAAPDEEEQEPPVAMEPKPSLETTDSEPEPSSPDRWGKIGWRDWLREVMDRAPLVLRVPRGYVLVGVGLLAAFIGFAYWIGHDRGTRIETPVTTTPQTGDQNLITLSNILKQNGSQAGFNTPGPRTGSGRDATGVRTGENAIEDQTNVTPPVILDQPKPKMVHGTADPRQADNRYFILAAYSVNKAEYMTPLLEYLWSQGVEAGAFNSHNSGLYEVIALQGFAKADLDSNARKDYESLLRRVGKQWKQQAAGNNDLGGMYPRRFDGTAARKSITKAN